MGRREFLKTFSNVLHYCKQRGNIKRIFFKFGTNQGNSLKSHLFKIVMKPANIPGKCKIKVRRIGKENVKLLVLTLFMAVNIEYPIDCKKLSD